MFDHEPLERVVAEYNRYTAKPIEIATPALRNLEISAVFATDDTDTFIELLPSNRELPATHSPIWSAEDLESRY